VVQKGLDNLRSTPITAPETVMGRVKMTRFSSMRFLELSLFRLPKLEYMDATDPPSRKMYVMAMLYLVE
jgi:hypothetical protein